MKKAGYIFMFLTLTLYGFGQEWNKGFIFNVDNILEGIDTYQGGIGVKIGQGEEYYRLLADFYYNHNSKTQDLTLGVAYERHTQTGRISPYYGAFVDGTYLVSESTATELFELNTGGLMGIEIFFLDFLSLFGEYQLALEYQQNIETGDEDLTLNTDIGNQGRIGIVIYLTEVVTLD